MNVTGIIAEYNPFHNGHAYHLRESRRLTGADYIIVVMSGNFVQRGEPAIIHKYARTEMALRSGADLVLELPVCYATGSAEYFALGSISLLDGLGCVDHLCFGSESGDLTVLRETATILAEEPLSYQEKLKSFLQTGFSYPLARTRALAEFGHSRAVSVLSRPNNTLGVEYIKALLHRKSDITPVTIPRMGADYHDVELHGEFCSASALRSALAGQPDCISQSQCPSFAGMVPDHVSSILKEAWHHIFPVFPKDVSSILHYRLLMASTWEELGLCFDVPEDLARRIFCLRSSYQNYDSFTNLVKTRNITELSVRRALIHILLSLPASEIPKDRSCPYARVLGFRRQAAPLLKEIKEKGHLPLITKPADAPLILNSHDTSDGSQKNMALSMLDRDILASRIYQSAVTGKFSCLLPDDYRQKLIVL